MVNHATMNKLVKITDTMFVWYMQWAPSTIQMKTKMPGYMIKKVHNVYMWSPFIMQLNFFTGTTNSYSSYCTVYRCSAVSGLPHNAASINFV